MTDLDKLEDLVTELYQFTIPMTKEAMNECMEEITEKVLAKREHRDKLNDLYPQWLFVLGDKGQEAEFTIQSEMLATGHGHRWPEVQALGREMYNMNHPTQTPLSPIQPTVPLMPTPAPPSPMGNPLFPGAMPLPLPGHTPCLVTTMATGEAIVTPMAPSPSPLGGVLPPMLPLLMPGGLGMGFTGEPIPEMLPELTLNRSKSVPQGAGMGIPLKINILQDSIQEPSLEPLPIYNGGGIHRSSRSRSRDRADADMPLPTGPQQRRSHSRERREPSRDRDIMKLNKGDSGLHVPISKLGVRSNSMPTLKNRKSSSRRRRRKQPTKRELAEAKLQELGDRYGPRFTRTGMRGENVLRLKAKTKRALENIVPFIEFLDNRITLEEVSCPLSRPAKEQKQRGFLAYIKTRTVAEAQEVHKILFDEYCGQNLDSEGKPPFKLIELNPMAKGAKLQLEQEKAREAALLGATEI